MDEEQREGLSKAFAEGIEKAYKHGFDASLTLALERLQEYQTEINSPECSLLKKMDPLHFHTMRPFVNHALEIVCEIVKDIQTTDIIPVVHVTTAPMNTQDDSVN